MDLAACADQGGDWFPETSATDTSVEKGICARCPVRQACLAYALDVGEPFGIWGGLTTTERLTLIEHLTAIGGPAAGDVARAA